MKGSTASMGGGAISTSKTASRTRNIAQLRPASPRLARELRRRGNSPDRQRGIDARRRGVGCPLRAASQSVTPR
ncbi:MAG: hypothetical protein C3F11_13205, partial [Methylocystaceae bacterium]